MAPKPPKRAETVAEAAYAADQTRLEKKRAELQDAIAVALDSENWELLDDLNDEYDGLPTTVQDLRQKEMKEKTERAAERKAAENAEIEREQERKALAAAEEEIRKTAFKERIKSLEGRKQRNQEASKAVYRDNMDEGKRLARLTRMDEEALFHAALSGDCRLIEKLSRRETDINSSIQGGFTPAFAAAEKGHLDVLALLHSLGADLNKADDRGQTPLAVALFKKNGACVQYLRQNNSLNIAVGIQDEYIAVSRPGSRGSPVKIRPP